MKYSFGIQGYSIHIRLNQIDSECPAILLEGYKLYRYLIDNKFDNPIDFFGPSNDATLSIWDNNHNDIFNNHLSEIHEKSDRVKYEELNGIFIISALIEKGSSRSGSFETNQKFNPNNIFVNRSYLDVHLNGEEAILYRLIYENQDIRIESDLDTESTPETIGIAKLKGSEITDWIVDSDSLN